MNLISAELSFEVAADLFDKIRRERVWVMRQMKHNRGGLCVVGLGRCDLSVFEHGVDYAVTALLDAIGMVDRRIIARSLGQARRAM